MVQLQHAGIQGLHGWLPLTRASFKHSLPFRLITRKLRMFMKYVQCVPAEKHQPADATSCKIVITGAKPTEIMSFMLAATSHSGVETLCYSKTSIFILVITHVPQFYKYCSHSILLSATFRHSLPVTTNQQNLCNWNQMWRWNGNGWQLCCRCFIICVIMTEHGDVFVFRPRKATIVRMALSQWGAVGQPLVRSEGPIPNTI